MILRVTLKVPDGEKFNGDPLLLGDLLVNGKALKYGGQVADTIDIGLYAIIITGGSAGNSNSRCFYKCCSRFNVSKY